MRAMVNLVFQKAFLSFRKSGPRLYGFSSWAGFCLIVTLLLGFCLVRAVLATRECLWPIGWDLLRDVSMGQVMLDGRYPEDPILLNETLWYNPLTGAILAFGHLISGLSMPRVGVLIGPFLNLLAPLGFTVAAAYFFGRAAALAGLCMVLFGRDPAVSIWVTFSYSPWVTASLYAAGLMLFLFFVYYNAFQRQSCPGYIAAGMLLGVVFMAHTAPAIVAGGAMLLHLVWEEGGSVWARLARRRNACPPGRLEPIGTWRPVFLFSLLLLVAFLASLPYTGSILWNYQFQVCNPAPSLFALDYVLLEQLPDRIGDALNWPNGFALIGFLTVLCRRNRADRFVLCWTLTVSLLLIQHYLWQLLENHYGVRVPGLVPGHHGTIHMTAVRAVFFGAGIAFAGNFVARGIGRLCQVWGGSPSPRSFSALSKTAKTALACAAGVLLYLGHPLMTHPDFQRPDMNLYARYHQRGIPIYEWILEHTDPDAVFICNDDEIAMTIVMPAARKLLFPPYIYSNPFVDPGPLSYHDRLLREAAKGDDAEVFCTERSKYSNVYMILREEEFGASIAESAPLFSEVFRTGGLVLLEARSCRE